jgi:hypothetical protein
MVGVMQQQWAPAVSPTGRDDVCGVCHEQPPALSFPLLHGARVREAPLCYLCWLRLLAGWKSLFPDTPLSEFSDPAARHFLTHGQLQQILQEGARHLARPLAFSQPSTALGPARG